MRKDNVVVQNNHHLLHYHHQLFIIMLIVIIIVIMQRVRGADSGKYLTGETTLTVTHSRQLHHHHHHCSHRHHRSHRCHHPYRHHHHVFHHQRRWEKSRKKGSHLHQVLHAGPLDETTPPYRRLIAPGLQHKTCKISSISTSRPWITMDYNDIG